MELSYSLEKKLPNVRRCDEDENATTSQELIRQNNEISRKNNEKFELEKQKQTLNSRDEKYKKQKLKESIDMAFSKQEDVSDSPMTDVDFRKSDGNKVLDTESNHEHKNLKYDSDTENTETIKNTRDKSASSKDSPQPQFLNVSDVRKSKLTNIFPIEQLLFTGNKTNTLNCHEHEKESEKYEHLIHSPKINGDHKDVRDSTGNSVDSPSEGLDHLKDSEKLLISQKLSDIGTPAYNKTSVTDNCTNENDPAINTNLIRCQTPDSMYCTSPTLSSSSENLVIDQPNDEEKISPLRLKLKRTRNENDKQTVKFLLNRKKEALLETSDTSEIQNVSDQSGLEYPKKQHVVDSTLNSLLLNETNEMNDMHVGTCNVLQGSSVSEAFRSEKISTDLSCHCNRLHSDPHQRTCPSYKVAFVPSNYYKCSSCDTYHENWSFFLHIREHHDRFLCLYCIKCFPTAEKLSLHLEIKHDLEQTHFNSEESLRSSASVLKDYALETRFLLCCTCQHIFGERTAFTEHICMEYMKTCLKCGQKGRHSYQCKANPFVKRRVKKKIKDKQSFQTSTATIFSNIQEEGVNQDESIKPKSLDHDEDSNSSTNMVIDESCTTYHDICEKIHDSKETDIPDDHQMSQVQQKPSLQAHSEEPENVNVNRLKFKLRVPKEFQKPVDAAMSSSDSDDAIFEEEAADDFKLHNSNDSFLSGQETKGPNFNSKVDQLCHTDSNQSTGSVHRQTLYKSEESDEELAVVEGANPDLARILEEIEQTKRDIERTKETMNPQRSHNLKNRDCSNAENDELGSLDCIKVAERSPKRNWTPTPPASPSVVDNQHFATDKSSIELKTNENDYVENFEASKKSDSSTSNVFLEKTEHDSMGNNSNGDENKDKEPIEHNADSHTDTNSDVRQLSLSDSIDVANEDCLLIELQLSKPLEKYETVEFVRTCLKASYPFCLYCNHARRIAVNGVSLVLHLISQHRFSATVDSITAEELQPETIVARLKSFLSQLTNEYFNTNSYCTVGAGAFTRHFNERIFECFQCRFITATHKELYLHNRKMHLRTAILCFMCRCNFFSFSEILCHICPGVPHKASIFEINFRCCLCNLDNIPSAFRLMVHLRKRHFACDICLEDCRDQSKLSSHVWKHKLHHLCYRCGIAYRNKMDITKHLFWKHGTESAICKRCLNKRWPHVYHFCVPPTTFVCDICQHCFTKAMYLTVHKRIHVGDFRYPCTEQDCQEKFISRKLLLKHSVSHQALESSNEVIKVCDAAATDGDEVSKQLLDSEIRTAENEDIKNQLEGDEETKNQEFKNELKDTLLSEISKDGEAKGLDPKSEDIPKDTQKKKKKKRSKESLEDLNLIAPNLSESGSSSESESETISKCDEEEPKVFVSPQDDEGDVKSQKLSEMEESKINDSVLDIWKNFLQAQQAHAELTDIEKQEWNDTLVPKATHVCYSDHDYCKMFYPTSLKSNQHIKSKTRSKNKLVECKKRGHSMSRVNNGNSNASSSSSDESSDTSSSSSCSCGSNCSCSAGSSRSSSSSSSAISDSSNATRKRQRKKSEHNSRHKKTESISPRKSRTITDIGEPMEMNEKSYLKNLKEPTQSDKAEKYGSLVEVFINETDLETAESETDEEYYDNHPQKMASELLSQKRAQLMARISLSPSHNFDIVENSRPSTPSLPEDIIFEKRKKKKKRDRKSISKSNVFEPKLKFNQSLAKNYKLEYNFEANEGIQCSFLTFADNSTEGAKSTGLIEPPKSLHTNMIQHATPHISEGSSCSDIDGSLKRSKRARRPNKFYGYTSDDESIGSSRLVPSLLVGSRAFKPQPPPQLVWNKEDLPTPSKSILNIKKTPRAHKRQEADSFTGLSTTDNEVAYGTLPKKKKMKLSLESVYRKRSKNLPPIPRLKIRSALHGIGNLAKEESNQFDYCFNKSDESSEISSDEGLNQTWNDLIIPQKTQSDHYNSSNVSQTVKPELPTITEPLIPTPQITVFNQKIPPALLPNPDFTTLQYFKANNIRYPIRPPAGARAAREGESVYCYCRCPYDEVSEMIACDGDNCLIEWFHFECVGIMVAPQGQWFCAECRPHYSEDLYPQTVVSNLMANLRES